MLLILVLLCSVTLVFCNKHHEHIIFKLLLHGLISPHLPQIGIVGAMMIVWRVRAKSYHVCSVQYCVQYCTVQCTYNEQT